ACERDRGIDPSPRLAALVAAVGTRRAVEPRLTGGFAYGPLRSPSRGTETSPLDSAPPDVRIAVAEIEKRAMQEYSNETLALLGLAHLSVGNAAKAVPLLEQAASVKSASALVRSDLAAAYLVHAVEENEAQDLPKALTVADLAIRSDPSLAEARFNRALALARLHLDDLSRIEWQEYLRLDGRSPWSDEARSHLAVQGEPPTTAWNADYRRIEAAVDGSDQATLTKTIELAIQSARDWA